jgi:hypothetical protein
LINTFPQSRQDAKKRKIQLAKCQEQKLTSLALFFFAPLRETACPETSST